MNGMSSYVRAVREKGYAIVESVFGSQLIGEISARVEDYCSRGFPGITFEKQSGAVRSIHGPHLFDEYFKTLACEPACLDIVREHLGDAVYIHQFKINMKRSMEGANWPWHQDFVYWQRHDHIEQPRLVNLCIALDDITLLNGALCVIPRSHLNGDLTAQENGQGDWRDHVSADLSYTVSRDKLGVLIEQNGYEYLTCRAGDVILFDPQLVHASNNNMSPLDRKVVFVTYNAVSNLPRRPSARPSFISGVDFSPL